MDWLEQIFPYYQFHFIIFIIFYHFKNRMVRVGDFDTRKEVENEKKYPYSCVGLILGKFTEQKEGEEFVDKSFRGTRFLIGPNIILTCAHNAYNSNLKVEAK